jgi:hypothetical protein
MRLHIGAPSNSRQFHAVGLQAQALQSVPLQLLRFKHGGPRESLPLPSHVSSVLSVVYTTKNRIRIAGTIVFTVLGGDRYQLGIELAGHVCNWPVADTGSLRVAVLPFKYADDKERIRSALRMVGLNYPI